VRRAWHHAPMTETLPTTNQTAVELRKQIMLAREGKPFLIFRNAEGKQVLATFARQGSISLGRSRDADVSLAFDQEASRLHAEIYWRSGEWVLADDGLSSNGSFVNGERVTGRRRLHDGDVLRIGRTLLVFKDPLRTGGDHATVASRGLPSRRELSRKQLEVLAALCEPLQGKSVAAPASNDEIATTLNLSVSTVKSHLRQLFHKFGVEDFGATRKRIRLAELALISGAVSPRAD
jgi:pSer/pThr/pTyr-binding forkhead associated (FHA) protein